MKKRREEERRILAEFDEALKAERGEDATPATEEKATPCPRCKSGMKRGVCSTCGYKVYIPMDEGKQKKIRGIVTAVCLVGFVILFLIINLK